MLLLTNLIPKMASRFAPVTIAILMACFSAGSAFGDESRTFFGHVLIQNNGPYIINVWVERPRIIGTVKPKTVVSSSEDVPRAERVFSLFSETPFEEPMAVEINRATLL